MQKLTMPFKRQMMLCGYKSAEYFQHWGYQHYGVDISTIQGGAGDNHNIYASGTGVVVACGWDNSGGNVVVITYDDCYNHNTGEMCSLVARYMHLQDINVQKGQNVVAGDIIGTEGKTKATDYHLHIEFDTDIKYPLYSPQVASTDDKKTQAQGNILIRGLDTTVNPSYILHIGDGQEIVDPTYNPAWLNEEDFTIPQIGNSDCGECVKLKEELEKEKEARNQMVLLIEDLIKSYQSMG